MPLSPIAGAVIADGGRVLLIRRNAPAGALLWTFPSGKVETGETAHQAAAHEATEEAGVIVAPLVILGGRVHPDTGHRVVYVACRLLSGTAYPASPREVAETRWVRLGKIPELIPAGLHGPVQAYLGGALR
ncbi:NUDIX hydrolase [Streptomyces sviceus]|uniref:NUDIX hydrolase n=1 Tax=Streptomyces sviceus TaxID=285530 RepID=UPI00367AB5CC